MAENLDDIPVAGEVWSEEVKRSRGRPKGITDSALFGNRDFLVWLLENTWAEIGLHLRWVKNAADVLHALRCWHDYRDGHPIVAALLRPTGRAMSSKSLRALQRRKAQLIESMSNVQDWQKTCQERLGIVQRVLAQDLPSDQRHALEEEQAKRAETLLFAEAEYLAEQNKLRDLDEEIKDGHAYIAQTELIRFRKGRRYAINPLNIANALAGWPNIRYRQSIKRCRQMKPLNAGSLPYQIFKVLQRIVDQDAAFVMLERDGSVLATTGPVRSSDARLRRAQALAFQSGASLQIVRELIDQKIAGQSRVVRDKLRDSTLAQTIQELRRSVPSAGTIHELNMLESAAATAYWSGWQTISINFPKSDLPRVPDHWKSFRARRSPISGSQRVAADPVNAMLNYLYALLEAEARLAITALGLDPGLGFLHLDAPARDSLASDVMEPVRPEVDAFVLDWIMRTPLKRKWFFERPDGNCRLMAVLAAQLSETAPTWRLAVAPFAERVARILWQTTRKSKSNPAPPTRLTQRHKREAKGALSLPIKRKPRPQNICQGCGSHISPRKTYCFSCGVATSTERLLDIARQGRIIATSPEVNARRAEKTRGHNLARWGWAASSQPAWLTNEFYETKIQPLLCNIPRSTISAALGISKTYAGEIRTGRSLPHPRHWQALAKLVGVSEVGRE